MIVVLNVTITSCHTANFSLTVVSVVIWMLGVVIPHVECVAPADLRNIIWDICPEECGTQASSQAPEAEGKEGLFPLKSGSRWASCNKMAWRGKNFKKGPLLHAVYGNPCTRINNMLPPSAAHVGGVGVESHMPGIPCPCFQPRWGRRTVSQPCLLHG